MEPRKWKKKFFDFLTKKIKKFFTKNAKNRKITLWRRENGNFLFDFWPNQKTKFVKK